MHAEFLNAMRIPLADERAVRTRHAQIYDLLQQRHLVAEEYEVLSCLVLDALADSEYMRQRVEVLNVEIDRTSRRQALKDALGKRTAVFHV